MEITTTLLITTAIDNGAIELFIDANEEFPSAILLSRNGKNSVIIQMRDESIPERVAVDYLVQLEMSDLIEAIFPGFLERYRKSRQNRD